MTIDLLDVALRYQAAGCSVVPVASDGGKLPAVAWTGYQTTAPTPEQLRRWFTAGQYDGLGLICGAVSGQLEMLEVEGRAADLVARLAALMADHGLADLWTRLVAGHAEITPSGGMHWLYRVDGAARRNLKLARRPSTPDELAAWQASEIAKAHTNLAGDDLARRLERIDAMTCERLPQVLIETRGEGGFTVLAPSGGRTHPSGKPWLLIAGGIEQVPTLTEAERDALHAVAGMLDQMPAEQPAESHAPRSAAPTDGSVRPGDDFNARADWSQILIPHGWTEGKPLGRTRTWIRPGKDRGDGISATTGRNGGDNLYVFSSSTEFDTETAYSKFAAYTLLEHGGDWTAAAKQLRSDGYGTALEPSRPAEAPITVAGALGLTPAVDGNLATVHQLDPAPPERPPLAVVTERTLERSDDGNALLLVERFGDRIRYCHDRGKWLAWDGSRWAWAERGGGIVREYAKRIARSLPEDDSPALTHKRRSLGAVGTTAMLTQAATDNRVSVGLDELDAHPWELNTPDGIVDLRTSTLQPADPARLHTRITAYAPDFTADQQPWQTFLADTFGGDQELIGYLQRLVGYSAVGLVGPHVLPFCHGSGGNGKGVFLEALAKVLGDYATTAPSGFLMATAHSKHETEIARLAGARMVLCSEVNEDDHFDEAKVKQLTGGDTLTARFMQQDHFTFAPTHQLWLMGNHKPAVRSGGRSFWRRLRLVPFEHEVPEAKVVDDLQGILARDHGPALLAWIAAGAAQYADGGLREPASVKAATEDYAHDQDTVTRFLEEQCRLGGGEHVQIKVTLVRAAYEQWCADAGEVPVSAKAFGMQMQRRGVDTRRTNSARFYVGLALLSDENASPGDDRAGRSGW
jgi:P4 family phage/plasmid primase-like protien